MLFSVSATFLALIGSAFAQTANFDAISSPAKGQELVVDGKQSYKVVWDPTPEYNGQTVSIRLLQGASQDTLDFYPGANVASSIDSALGTYTWTPDSSIAGYATYGLKLQLDSDTSIFQYSFPFKITAGSASSTTLAAVSSSVSSTATIPSQNIVSSTTSSASQASVSSKVDSVSTVTSPASASVTASTAGSTATGSATGTGSGAQTTLATTTKPSSTGSSTTSATSAVVTAGAGRVMAGGSAAMVVMAAVFAF